MFRLFKQDTIDRWYRVMETRRLYSMEVNYWDYARAKRNFDYCEQKRRVANQRSFHEYTRGHYGYINGRIHFTEEMGKVIKLWCSPHYHALFKASAIRGSILKK